ncbi:uncharacterized protein PHACADRAFT_191104 [Phanerochaete carnosa HHB-10118-sp]|uniref:Uncharacterized protein n=1 Tax=Phanerochaete carnosa (strain HHB-10118-sp) TaxID=650164 RepID=K5V7L4_PHACS|nr:uncharacterized protein PHACADRAFT_191104 [Phanerochaete carnosa HHB-10118-sp]EKM58761.1 hypothetical protein PHACADRAFT_191104 [Phanerochaete carnosa HHB-10118-sp]
MEALLGVSTPKIANVTTSEPIWGVYAAELSSTGFGYSMWFPEPLEDGSSPEKGDVGYIYQGRFRCLFNVAKRPEDHAKQLLYSYTVLDYDKRLDKVVRDVLQMKIISSQGIMTMTVQASENICSLAGSNVGYRFIPTDLDSLIPNSVFPHT